MTPFLSAIDAAMKGCEDSYEIIFVDDASQDNTRELIDGLIAQRFLTPSLVPDDLIIAAFERLA